MMKSAKYWIEKLELIPHPEGGYFKEAFRSEEGISKTALPERYTSGRNYYSSIYFLLKNDDISAFHRLKSDEVWHHYEGCSVELHVLSEGGGYKLLKLGKDLENGETPQVKMKKGDWFGAELRDKSRYALTGCTVAPAFEYEDFEFGRKSELLKEYPEQKEVIERLGIKK